MKRLDEIEARANAATEGPWESDGTGEVSQHWSRPEPWETVVGTGVTCMSYCYGGSAKVVERADDAEFIAASRTDVPALVAALRAVIGLHRIIRVGGAGGTTYEVCQNCNQPAPCAYIQAIRQHLGEDE